MPPSILNLCARIEGHSSQRQQLRSTCRDFSRWDFLLPQAEKHGLGPLLRRHLEIIEADVPATFLRGLRFLCLRHQHANSVRMTTLQHVLALLQTAGIPSLVLKGGALCQTLYPRIDLRPMRDLDLMISPENVFHAHALLQENGFRASTAEIPEGHHHLAALYQSVEGLQVCVELHHDLFPYEPPYYQALSFKELFETAKSFELDGVKAYTLGDEEMLWHLFQHGFRAPLPYEPYKLISVADIVSLVESKVEQLDWEKIKTVYPQLFKSIPHFHHLTPWSDKVLTKIPPIERPVPTGVGASFSGWPGTQSSASRDIGLLGTVYLTFFPAQWWMMLYYSTDGLVSYLWCRVVRHPLHILRWVKIKVRDFLSRRRPSVKVGRG